MPIREMPPSQTQVIGKPIPAGQIASGDSSESSSNLKLKKALEHRHAEYDKYKNAWTRCMDCYVGEIEKMREYIHKHQREHDKDFLDRAKRAIYLNYCEPVVDLYMSYAFRKPPVRKPLGDLELPYVPLTMPSQEAPPGAEAQLDPGQEMPNGGKKKPPPFAGKVKKKTKVKPSEDEENEPVEDDPGAEEDFPGITDGEDAPPPMEEPSPDMTAAEIAYFASQGGPQKQYIFNELYRDADLQGTTFDRFMQELGAWAQIHGHTGVLVDSPQIEEGQEPKTEQQRKDMNLRPYLVRYPAESIVDWVLDSKGQFEWVRLMEPVEEPREPFDDESKTSTLYRTFTKNEWFLHKIDDKQNVTVEGKGTHDLGVVPLVIAYNKKKKGCQLVGDSSIDDISVLNLALLNWMSLLDEEIYNKCLNILVMKKSAMSEGMQEVVISQHNVIEYEEEPPAFIAAATTPGEFILSMMKALIEEIYRIAKMGGGGQGLRIQEAVSGVAHAYEFNETNQALADKADQLESAEMKIHEIYAMWWGIEFKGQINYPDEFGVEDLNQEFDFLTKSRGAITSITAKRELEKRVVKKLLQTTVDQQTLQRIMGEIDQAQPDDYRSPGEFVVPGETKGFAPPGAGAVSGEQIPPEFMDQFLAEQQVNEKYPDEVPKGIQTVGKRRKRKRKE